MQINSDTFIVSHAPHFQTRDSVPKIMWTVFISLIPALLFAIYQFGMAACYVTLLSVFSCIIFEILVNLIKKESITIYDGSAAVTGIIFAFTLPPYVPYFIVIIGAFFAIVIVKGIFGGLGNNWINPAAAARVFVMFAWLPELTGTCWLPENLSEIINSPSLLALERVTRFKIDSLTFATPLQALANSENALGTAAGALKSLLLLTEKSNLSALFTGIGSSVYGCIGEIPKLGLLIGAVILFYKKIITWHIPVVYLLTVFILSIFIMNPLAGQPETTVADVIRFGLFHLFTGGLIFGAFFMATDMVTSPVSGKGQIIFAIFLGIITFIIRKGPGYPEGVSFAIILMNCFVPFINKYTKPKVFGAVKTADNK